MGEGNEELITVREAAERVGRSPQLIHKLIRKGELPAVNAGKRGLLTKVAFSDLEQARAAGLLDRTPRGFEVRTPTDLPDLDDPVVAQAVLDLLEHLADEAGLPVPWRRGLGTNGARPTDRAEPQAVAS